MFDIANLTTQKIDKNFLQKTATKAMEVLKQKNASLSLVLVGAGKIRQLNKTWRGRNRVTDVLAFPYKKQAFACLRRQACIPYKTCAPDAGKNNFILPKKFDNFLGEIFICLPQAKKQAKKLGHSLKNELTLLLTHGILHLVGYEDEGTEREREKMREMEQKIIDKLT